MAKLKPVPIINLSGFDVRSERSIPPLRDNGHVLLNKSVGGDAPKDFVGVYEYGHSRKRNITAWPAYIAKVGHKWYPSESITEHLLTRIGQCLGLNMAQSRLMRAAGQIRFLSKFFLAPDQQLVHGAEIYTAHLEDEDFVKQLEREKLDRDMLTFQFTCEAISHVFPDHCEALLENFVSLLGFDALVGNNDRHHYNWGVVTDVRGAEPPSFAPIYDTARALCWNRSEGNLAANCKTPEKQRAFLNKYARGSTPKIGWDGEKDLDHFRLIALLKRDYSELLPALECIVNRGSLDRISRMMNHEFQNLMSVRRREVILECLKLRFELYERALSLEAKDV